MASSSPFSGARALVTGASAGIGAAIARRLARAGASLALTARRADRLDALVAECRTLGAPAAHAVVDDLADPAGPARVAAAAVERLGGVDVLVNNAGFGVPGLSERMPLDRALAMVDVNVKAPIVLTRTLLPAMLERRRGWILQVASVAGLAPSPYHAAYAGTKAFLANWAQSMHEELRRRGVVVTALCPGVTDTEFFDVAGYPRGGFLERRMPSDRVAAVGLAALGRGRALAVPGVLNKLLVVVGTRLAPRGLTRRIAGRLMRGRPEPRR